MASVIRPGRVGGKKILTRKSPVFSAESKKSRRRKFAAKSAERRQAAIKEILVAYEPGWTCLHERHRNSLTGIALGLSRHQLVTSLSDKMIVPLLKELARKRKIKLPPKLPWGGSKKKKAKKKK